MFLQKKEDKSISNMLITFITKCNFTHKCILFLPVHNEAFNFYIHFVTSKTIVYLVNFQNLIGTLKTIIVLKKITIKSNLCF